MFPPVARKNPSNFAIVYRPCPSTPPNHRENPRQPDCALLTRSRQEDRTPLHDCHHRQRPVVHCVYVEGSTGESDGKPDFPRGLSSV
jgi:hypothetical protein